MFKVIVQMRVGAELIIRPLKGNWLRFSRRRFGERCTDLGGPFGAKSGSNNGGGGAVASSRAQA
jgi:hypothetical protein